MLGVLIATDGEGHDRTLYAFSGQLGNGGFHYDGFVGPVFDYLHPDGYFKRKEADISLQNVEISKYEEETVSVLQRDYEHQKKKGEAEISEFGESVPSVESGKRDARRKAGDADETELTAGDTAGASLRRRSCTASSEG